MIFARPLLYYFQACKSQAYQEVHDYLMSESKLPKYQNLSVSVPMTYTLLIVADNFKVCSHAAKFNLSPILGSILFCIYDRIEF